MQHILLNALAASAAIALIAPAAAWAQAYPSKPITLSVSQAAGSATDIMARVLGQKLGDVLGQPVVIDNKAGAGGTIGTEMASRAKPDGYTLLLASVSTHGVNPVVYKNAKYDALKDFTPISMTATTANLIVVSPNSPHKTLADLVAAAKKSPGKLTYGSSGVGSSQHLASEYLKTQAGGLFMLHIPYRGAPPAMTGVMAGEVDWMMPAVPSSVQFVKQGKLRALAVTSTQRLAELPDVPTVAETLKGFEVSTWYALVAPAGLPPEMVSKLNAAVATTLKDPAVVAKMASSGLAAEGSTPPQLTAYIKRELDRWAKVAAYSKISLD